MESEIVFKEILDVAGDIGDRSRKASAGRSTERKVVSDRSSASGKKRGKAVTWSPSSATPEQGSEIGVHSMDPIFKEKSKDIFNTDFVTAKFDISDGMDVESTGHFLCQPRPMTSSLSDPEPLVRYKCKTLSGSSAMYRKRNSHNKAEKEYRDLKDTIAKLQKQQNEKKEETEDSPEPTMESTPFSNYVDSLWERQDTSKYELLRTKELKLNFFKEHDKTKTNLTYSNH